MSKNNSKLAQKLQSDIDSSKPTIISNDDNMSFLKKKYGNKYNDDISDTEDDNVSISDKKNVNNSDNSVRDNKQNKKPNEYSQEFKQMVVQYIKSDDKIREVNEQLKEYKAKKKQAEEFILKELENYDEKAIIVSGSMLRKNEQESKSALKQDIIKDALMNKLNSESEVKKLLELMDQKRSVVKRVTLKRIIE